MFLASKSSLTVSPYQLIFPANLPFKLLLRRPNNSECVRSFFRRADRIAFLSDSYFSLSIFFPVLPSGCFVSIFSAVIPLLPWSSVLTVIHVAEHHKHAFEPALVNPGHEPGLNCN